MTETTGGSLNAAYEAIKAKDLAKARDVLSAYLVDHPNDADAWWLYSYAVSDVEQGRKALETVLRLDPSYPGARDLLNELEAASPSPAAATTAVPPPPASIRPMSKLPEAGPLKTTVDPDEDGEAEFGFADEGQPAASRFGRLLIAGIAAAVVLAIIAVVFILPMLNRGPQVAENTPQPTSAVAGATDAPTDDPSLVATGAPTDDTAAVATDAPTQETSSTDATDAPPAPTEEPTTDSPTEEPGTSRTEDTSATSPTAETGTDEVPTEGAPEVTDVPPAPTTETSVDGVQPVYDSLTSYSVVPDSAGREETSLGQTVTVSICAVSSELRSVIPGALTDLAAISPQLPSDTEAIGARFLNCTDNQVLRFVALGIADAQAYATGALTDTDLRSRFVPLP